VSDRSRLEYLLGKALGAELDAGEEAELLRALESDASLAAEFARDARFHGLLSLALGEEQNPDRFERSLAARLKASQGDTAFLRSLEAKIKDPPRSRPSFRPSTRRKGRAGGWRPWLPPLIACAGVLVGIALVFSLRPANRSSEDAARPGSSKRPESPPERAKAEEERAQAEERVSRLQEQEKRAAEALKAATDDLKRKAEEAFLDIARKRKEEEERLAKLRQAEEEARRVATKPVPEPAVEEKPSLAPKRPETQAVVAKLEHVAGEVVLASSSGRAVAKGGEELRAGHGVEVPGGGKARLKYPDGTWVELGPGTELKDLRSEGGKRSHLVKGHVRAVVTRQAKDQPMVFATPHGDATVLGTTLRIVVDPDPRKGTRLDVDEGKVRLTRSIDPKFVEVPNGHYAVAATGIELIARRISSIVSGMAPNSWMTVSGTHLREVAPDASKYPQVRGIANTEFVIDSWSGGAFDPRGNQLILWGGGVTNYHGNELYAFKVDSLKWERLTDPTPNPADGRQVNGDGTPNSRATYNGLACITNPDRLFALGGYMAGTTTNVEAGNSLWTFDFAEKRWKEPNPTGSRPPAGFPSACSYDPLTRRVWWCEATPSAPGLYSYDCDKNLWVRHTSDLFNLQTSAVDTRRGLLFIVGNGEVVAYSLREKNPTRKVWTTVGGDAFIGQNQFGLDYDPASDRIVGWHGGPVYSLNPETRAWTVHAAPGAPAKTPNGIFGRWRYVPSVKAFIAVTSVDENVHFFKLPTPR